MMTQSGVPPSMAAALIKRAVGQRILSLQAIVRYPLEKLASDLSLRDSNEYFRFAPEVVFIEFSSGFRIRISADAKKRTVLVSEGCVEPLVEAEEPDYLDRRGIVLSASDPLYSDDRIRALLGASVKNIGILFVENGDSRAVNERGIVFVTNDKTPTILGLQLRRSIVSSLSFLEFGDLSEELCPFLRFVGIDGIELPIPER